MRTHCKDCQQPREPESTSYSYCVGCGRKRQREGYRKRMEASGRIVTPRIGEPVVPAHVSRNQRKPGICEGCHEYTLPGTTLDIVFRYPLGPPAEHTDADGEFDIANMPQAFMLACNQCSALLRAVPAELWDKFLRLNATMIKRKVTRGDLLPEPERLPTQAFTPTDDEE